MNGAGELLLTDRLRLSAMHDAALFADRAADYAALARELQCVVGAEWPPENWETHVFEYLEQQLAASPEQRAWQRYIVLRGEPDVLVGNCNGFSVSPSEVEIGYSVLPAFQRRGIATEAARALVELLRQQGFASVRAQTYPHLIASMRVMEGCGMRFAGEGEAGTVCYRIDFLQAPGRA